MEPFGEVISSYSRAQALEDGVLGDVSEKAREAGFKIPVAITERLHNHLEGESYNGRLWDVLNVLMFSIRQSGAGERIYFKVKIGRKVEDLWAVCGPGDNMEPVITIMFQDED